MGSKDRENGQRAKSRDENPYVILAKLIVGIFAAEVCVMWILQWLIIPEGWLENLADALLLTTGVSPGIYWLVVRPLRKSREMLRRTNEGLERKVEERTAELLSANTVLNKQIAERERAEVALRESEQRFRSVAQSAGDAIIVADSSGRIVSWNRRAEIIFGYTEVETIGGPLTLLMPERCRDAHRKGLERYRSTGEPSAIGRTVELQGVRKDGSEFPLELSLAAWKAGEETFYSGILRDITQRRQMEEALREAERTRVLVETAGAAAHEINQPLTVVIGHAQMLLNAMPSDDRQRGDMEALHEAGQRIKQIVEKMGTIEQYASKPYVGEASIVDFDGEGAAKA